MPIATRTSDPVLVVTSFTREHHAAQLAAAATHDVAEYFAVAQRNRTAERFQVLRCVLPKCRRHGDVSAREHLLVLRFELEQPVDQLAGVGFGGFGQVQINHRGLQA